MAQGFNLQELHILAEAIRTLAANFPVKEKVNSRHGTKYIVDGFLQTPIGKALLIRTVWIADRNADHPRFVTAYAQEN